MQLKSFFQRAVGAFASLVLSVSATQAATTAYNDGDIFLGFRASGGTGAASNYLVNLGQPNQFNQSGSINVGNIAADLTALYGAGWFTRTDIFVGVVGGSVIDNTLYASRPSETPWNRMFVQGDSSSLIDSLGTTYANKTSTASNDAGLIQAVASDNSYASFQPGGTFSNSGGISFSTWAPSIEGNPGTTLYLNKVLEGSTGPATVLGTLSLASNGTLTFTATPVITGPTVHFETNQYTVSEAVGGGTVSIKLIREGVLNTAFNVSFSTVAGTAVAGSDYVAQSNTTVSFAANQLEATVPVTILNRPGFLGDRTFNVALAAPTNGATVVAPTEASVKIVEADPEPAGQLSFSAASYQVAPRNAQGNPNVVAVTVVRANGSGGAVSVDLSVTGGTLVNGTDYDTFVNPTAVNFAAGATSQTVMLPLKALSAEKVPGTIILSLTNPTGGATLGATVSSTVTVLSAGQLNFSAATYQQVEAASGDVTLTVSVNRAVGQNGAISVDVTAAAGTATLADDFALPATPVTLSWADNDPAPKSFAVTIKADALAESAETFTLALQNIQGGASLGATATATVTILDADLTVPTVKIINPVANAVLRGSAVTISGSAKDNQGVGRVEVRLNGGPVEVLTPTAPTLNFAWTLTVTPEQGVNAIEVRSFDLQNNPAPVKTRSFTFTNVRPELAGAYNGLLSPLGAAAPLDYHGLVKVTVTKTGAFTGKVQLAGVKVPLQGVFSTGGDARFGTQKASSLRLAKVGDVELGHLILSVDTEGGQKVTGVVTNTAGGVGVSLAEIASADLAVYAAANNPAPATIKGKYTAIFQANPAPNNGVAANAFPQGDGFGQITVSSKGNVTLTATLADGSLVSYSNALSKNNEWPVYVSLYGKKGFVSGRVVFDSTAAQSDASSPTMSWFKSAGLPDQNLYPAGWPAGISTNFVAAKFIAPKKPTATNPNPANPDTVLGLGVPGAANSSTANIFVTLADGGLITSSSNDASLDANSKVTILGATAGGTAATGLKLVFDPLTGLFTGSFTHPESGKVKILGAAYQKTKSAAGFFLYQPSTGAPVGTPAESGAVGVATK